MLDGVEGERDRRRGEVDAQVSSLADAQLLELQNWVNETYHKKYVYEGVVAGYFYDGYNCFDVILVLFSWLDVMAEIALGAAGKSGNELFNGGFFNMLRVVRMCRLLRVLRLISISKIHRKKSMAASQLDYPARQCLRHAQHQPPWRPRRHYQGQGEGHVDGGLTPS